MDILLDWIRRTLPPSTDQEAKIIDFKMAANRTTIALEASCRIRAERTPLGCLDTAKLRLTAMLDALNTIRRPVIALYDSLSEEQNVRFDQMRLPGPGAAIPSVDDAVHETACPQDLASMVKSPMADVGPTIRGSHPQNAGDLDDLRRTFALAVVKIGAACQIGRPRSVLAGWNPSAHGSAPCSKQSGRFAGRWRDTMADRNP